MLLLTAGILCSSIVDACLFQNREFISTRFIVSQTRNVAKRSSAGMSGVRCELEASSLVQCGSLGNDGALRLHRWGSIGLLDQIGLLHHISKENHAVNRFHWPWDWVALLKLRPNSNNCSRILNSSPQPELFQSSRLSTQHASKCSFRFIASQTLLDRKLNLVLLVFIRTSRHNVQDFSTVHNPILLIIHSCDNINLDGA